MALKTSIFFRYYVPKTKREAIISMSSPFVFKKPKMFYLYS